MLSNFRIKTIQAFIFQQKTGAALGILELNKSIFANSPIRQDLIKRAITYELSWKEQGTESTKNLGQVRGSTRKPFPQKGRGKARVGTIRAPNFRGGYNVHGDRPHIKTIDIQRKVYNAAVRAALSTKFLQSQVHIVDSLSFKDDKKTELKAFLQAQNLSGKRCYLIYGNTEPEQGLILASDLFRSLKPTESNPTGEKPLLVSSAKNISVIPLLEFEIIIMDKAAVEVIERMYQDN